MALRDGLFVLVVVLGMTSTAFSRSIYRPPCKLPPKPTCFSPMATPYPAVIETIGCACTKKVPYCNDQLILPPLAVELPRDLGYFPAALPLVASYFEPELDYLTTGAYLPVAKPCSCVTLAAPISPDLAPLVKPIIL